MSDLRPLAGEFPPADREQWQALAAKALSRGGREVSPDDVEALMGTPTDDGYTVAALYTAADDSNVREPERPGEPDFRRGEVVQGWQVRQRLEGLPGPSVIAEELAGGTQGLWLAPPVDREAHDSVLSLIEGIDTGTTAVVLDALACPLSAHEALLRRFKEQGAAPGSGLGRSPPRLPKPQLRVAGLLQPQLVELLDLRRERRLRHEARLGRLAEVQRARHGHQVFELPQRGLDEGGHGGLQGMLRVRVLAPARARRR